MGKVTPRTRSRRDQVPCHLPYQRLSSKGTLERDQQGDDGDAHRIDRRIEYVTPTDPVTNKGAFYERGREPHPGEPPKLSLLIESNDSHRVENAIREIKRLLLEGTQAYLDTEARTPPTGGRYSVV